MKSLSAKTFQCGVTVQGLTTLSGTVYLTALTNTATWDYVVVGTTAQGQLYTRTYAQLMSDITSGIGLSGYVPTSRTLTINGVSYDLTANRSWTISTVDYTSRLQHVVKAGVAINKGQAVYVTSADGTNMIVGLASNASEATSSKTMGLLDATVSTNGFANVVTEGLLAGLDTSTAGAAGDPVWLGTGGNLIYGLINKPYAPAHLVFIGIVTRKNNSNGEIFVKVQNGFELKEIHDVDLFTTTPVNGHILGFDGTLWVNKTIAGWLGYTPANASGTTNYLPKFTGGSALGNSQIFDNGTNVGIGTASPSENLSVSGTFKSNYFWTASSGISQWGNYPAAYGTLTWDTGYARIHATGGNRLDLGGGGGLHMSISTTGNVGIGTTTPTQLLDIQPSSGTPVFRIARTGGTDVRIGASITATGGLIGTYTNSPFDIYTNSSTKVRITEAGDVGIGTTSPAAKLHTVGTNIVNIVQSSTSVSYTQYYNSSTGAGSTNDGLTVGNNGLDAYIWQRESANLLFGTSNTEAIRITSAGLVGIGTSSPATKFVVSNAGASGLEVDPAGGVGSGVLLQAYNRSTSAYMAQSYYALTHTFNVGSGAGTRALDITSAGNVGIGTSSPSRKLDVNGTSIFRDFTTVVSSNGNAVSNTTWLSTDSGITNIYTGGNATVQLNSNGVSYFNGGNLGIGTASPGYKLDIAGDTQIQSSYFLRFANEWGIQQTGTDLNIAEIGSADGRLYLKAGGNVGIGTTSPSGKLQIADDGPNALVLGSAQISTIGETNDAGYPGMKIVPYNSNIHIGISSTNDTRINLWHAGNNYAYWQQLSTYTIFSNYSSNALALQIHGGNVGIGTTSPGYKLEVSGIIKSGIAGNSSANYAALVVASAGTTTSQAAIAIQQLTSEGDTIIFGDYEPYVEYNFMHENASNVFHIHSGENTNSLGSNTFYNRSGNPRTGYIKWSLYQGNGDMHVGGSVGIGNTSPSTKLDVSGVITATGGNSTNWNTAYGWGNHASASYVPQARTLTINGTTYDLSANRSWTIPTSANIQEAANNGKVTTAASVGTTVITTVATATYDGATFNYVLKDGTNYRAGTIIAVWSAAAVQFNETTTNDIGSTVGVTFAVALNAGNAELRATSATSGWTVKVVTIGI